MKRTKRKAKRKRQFSYKDAELAAKISNDVAEGIDCGESRAKLRLAAAYWADTACTEAQHRAAAESQIEIFKSAKGLMDAALRKG
jgi:hypothetical protein